MKYLFLYEKFLEQAHDDEALNKLYKVVYDYKHNPNLFDGGIQVQKIIDTLEQPEYEETIKRIQSFVKSKYGESVLIYRGGENVNSDSNAGWSTSWESALNFAAQKDEYGELVVASVHSSKIVFHDGIFEGKIKGYYIDEDEVILSEVGCAKYIGCVDVDNYESDLKDKDKYTNLGYCSDKLIKKCKKNLEAIFKANAIQNFSL